MLRAPQVLDRYQRVAGSMTATGATRLQVDRDSCIRRSIAGRVIAQHSVHAVAARATLENVVGGIRAVDIVVIGGADQVLRIGHRVGAGSARADLVLPQLGINMGIQVCVRNPVVAGAAINDIVAVATDQEVITTQTIDRVIAGQAMDDVVTISAIQGVVAGCADNRGGTVGNHGIGAAGPVRDIHGAIDELQGLDPGQAVDALVAAQRRHRDHTVVVGKRVVVGREGIGRNVAAGTAGQHVVPAPTGEHIVAIIAAQIVGIGIADQGVGMSRAPQVLNRYQRIAGSMPAASAARL